MDLHDVVQKLDQLVGVLTHMLHGISLLDGVEVMAYLLDAAPRRSNNGLEILEVLDEEAFRRHGVDLIPAVGHRLSTAGLPQRIAHLEAEPLQEFKGRNANFGEQQIDVTWNEQTDPHATRLRHLMSRFGFCRHCISPLLRASMEHVGMDHIHALVVFPVVHRYTGDYGALQREGSLQRGRDLLGPVYPQSVSPEGLGK